MTPGFTSPQLRPLSPIAGGCRAVDVLGTPTGAALGTSVDWIEWEGGTSSGPGIIVGAPESSEALGTADSGTLVGIRGSNTAAHPGLALSTAPADLMVVTR